jgi:hypothetical protein
MLIDAGLRQGEVYRVPFLNVVGSKILAKVGFMPSVVILKGEFFAMPLL